MNRKEIYSKIREHITDPDESVFVEFHAETVTFYKKVKGFKEYQRIGSVPKYLDGSFLSDDLFTFVCEPINPVVKKTITVYPVGYKPKTLK